jgi:hypothetical protein
MVTALTLAVGKRLVVSQIAQSASPEVRHAHAQPYTGAVTYYNTTRVNGHWQM